MVRDESTEEQRGEVRGIQEQKVTGTGPARGWMWGGGTQRV